MLNADEDRLLLCVSMREKVDLFKIDRAVWHQGLDHVADLDFMHLDHATFLHTSNTLSFRCLLCTSTLANGPRKRADSVKGETTLGLKRADLWTLV